MNKKDLVLLARSVEWQYQLEAFTDDQLVSILQIVEATERSLTQQLASATITDWSRERTNLLLEEVQDLTLGVRTKLNDDIGNMTAVAGSEAYTAHSNILGFDGAAKAVSGVAFTAAQLRSVVESTPVGGNTLAQWVDSTFSRQLKERIQREITAGMLSGENYRELANRIKVGWTGTKTELETLVRTYVQSINTQAAQDVYDANPNIVKSVVWRATFGLQTCLRCAGLDGQEYQMNDHPPIPLHPRCRCVLIPVTVAAEKMGLDRKALNEMARGFFWAEENGRLAGSQGAVR